MKNSMLERSTVAGCVRGSGGDTSADQKTSVRQTNVSPRLPPKLPRAPPPRPMGPMKRPPQKGWHTCGDGPLATRPADHFHRGLYLPPPSTTPANPAVSAHKRLPAFFTYLANYIQRGPRLGLRGLCLFYHCFLSTLKNFAAFGNCLQ